MNQAQLPEIRKEVVIDLTEYGKQGTIKMARPDFYHLSAVQNTALSVIISSDDMERANRMDPIQKDKFIKDIMTGNMYTMQLITTLGYITEAPFHLNDLKRNLTLDFDAFMSFMTQPIYNRLKEAVDELEKGSPLPQSTASVQSTSE